MELKIVKKERKDPNQNFPMQRALEDCLAGFCNFPVWRIPYGTPKVEQEFAIHTEQIQEYPWTIWLVSVAEVIFQTR